MKKLLCGFLVCIMLIGMVGCAAEPNVRGDITPAPSGNTSTPSTEEKEFSLGSTKENHYNNDFLGLSCTLPTDWLFYTDEEILALNNIVSDVVDEDTAKLLENADVIYDMYATNTQTSASININLQKFTALQISALNMKTAMEEQFDVIKDSFEKMGYTNFEIHYAKITVDGKEYDGAELSAEIMGMSYHSTMFCFKRGRYLANVTVGAFSESEITTTLGYLKFA